MFLLNVLTLNQFSALFGKAELLVEERDEGTEAVSHNLDQVEGFVGRKEQAMHVCSAFLTIKGS